MRSCWTIIARVIIQIYNDKVYLAKKGMISLDECLEELESTPHLEVVKIDRSKEYDQKLWVKLSQGFRSKLMRIFSRMPGDERETSEFKQFPTIESFPSSLGERAILLSLS